MAAPSAAGSAAFLALAVVAALAALALLTRGKRPKAPASAKTPASTRAPEPPAEDAPVAARLRFVSSTIDHLVRSLGLPREPLLVAVSKKKSAVVVREAYDAGQRVFGENYVQELVDKAPQLPADCRWHFIGHLQSNKARQICAVPNLTCVQSVDSEKIATALDKACAAVGREAPLDVFVQVNSSGEESKHGVAPGGAAEVVRHVREACPNLRVLGLMTIGALDYSPNPECFERMVACRKEVAAQLGFQEGELALSMGMSADYEKAIAMGSTCVRVGSTIFGRRE